jgi:hypothetical protein
MMPEPQERRTFTFEQFVRMVDKYTNEDGVIQADPHTLATELWSPPSLSEVPPPLPVPSWLVIYDKTTNVVFAVFGKALKEEAQQRLANLKEVAIGTESNFRLTETTVEQSVGLKFVL